MYSPSFGLAIKCVVAPSTSITTRGGGISIISLHYIYQCNVCFSMYFIYSVCLCKCLVSAALSPLHSLHPSSPTLANHFYLVYSQPRAPNPSLSLSRISTEGGLTLLEPHSHMWGQNILIISSLSPKRDWGPERVNPFSPVKMNQPYFLSGISPNRGCSSNRRTPFLLPAHRLQVKNPCTRSGSLFSFCFSVGSSGQCVIILTTRPFLLL